MPKSRLNPATGAYRLIKPVALSKMMYGQDVSEYELLASAFRAVTAWFIAVFVIAALVCIGAVVAFLVYGRSKEARKEQVQIPAPVAAEEVI